MRGVSLMMEDDEKSIWCPIVYEYLQEFCYVVVTRDQILEEDMESGMPTKSGTFLMENES